MQSRLNGSKARVRAGASVALVLIGVLSACSRDIAATYADRDAGAAGGGEHAADAAAELDGGGEPTDAAHSGRGESGEAGDSGVLPEPGSGDRPREQNTHESAAAGGPKKGNIGRPSKPLKIALLGDQGVNANARAVLQLVVDEHADALIHLGDFAYSDGKPTAWDAQFDDVLGVDFPVFAAIGNHDVKDWSGSKGFLEYLAARLERMPDAHCSGDYGVNSSCTFRGLFFVLSGVGTYGTGHEAYLESALSDSDDAGFRLCIWHKNQHDMQVGAKTDEVGWDAYQICARHGVPVITGHEHSYSRSMVLTAIGDATQRHGAIGDPEHLTLEPGRTFVTVAGLGGQSMRTRTADHVSDSWWATIYARDYQLRNGVMEGTAPSIQYGALFLELGIDGDPKRARGYFKTTGGEVRDTFTLTSR
jgi:3',5'-cyclic AMP phosphodiesterase CpdA